MSDEIKTEFDDIIKENNQEDEKLEETLQKVSLNDDDDEEEEENEAPLSTPNGRNTPSAASFSDIIIEKPDDQTLSSSSYIIPKDNHADELLQIISEKSNKEANSTILNNVRLFVFFFDLKILFLFLTYIYFF